MQKLQRKRNNHLVPCFDSAYSQAVGTPNTPTTRIITKQFTKDGDENGERVKCMLQRNWRLLECGYLFVNSDYSLNQKRPAVEQLEIYDRMVEYLYTACKLNKPRGDTGSIISQCQYLIDYKPLDLKAQQL